MQSIANQQQQHVPTQYDYNMIIDNCLPFEDVDFPATLTSLFDPADYQKGNVQLLSTLEWRRAPDIYPEGFEVLPQLIREEDIVQGKLGDCYFVQCLVSLAAKPERIRKLFVTTKANSSGCYVVKMCVNGTWQEVVVDDYLPVFPNTNEIAFASSKLLYDQNTMSYTKGALWVSLLEKAFAKLHGTYERIVQGTLDMGFIHLCGVPSVDFKH